MLDQPKFIDAESPVIKEIKEREQRVKDLYVLLENPEITELQRIQLIRAYAQRYVAEHNEAVCYGRIEGEVLNETDFEAQIRADYEKLRQKKR